MPVKTCPICHKNFTLGVDGVVDPKTDREICDQCAGVRRDPQGYAWLPGETSFFSTIDGKVVYRPKSKR